MVVQSLVFEESLREGRFTDAEIQCKGFLRYRAPECADDLTMVSVLHCLAQALEAQGKVDEGFATRLEVKRLLAEFHNQICN